MRKKSPTLVFKHISYEEVFRMAVRNLLYKRFRTFITLLGIVIGVGSIYLLLSFGIGFQQLVEDQLAHNESVNTVDATPSNAGLARLNKSNIKKIESIAHVKSVSGVYTLASKVIVEQSSTEVITYASDDTYMHLANFSFVAGKNLSQNNTQSILVSNSLLQAIGQADAKQAIGKKLKMQLTTPSDKEVEKEFTIVGVVETGQGAEVFMYSKPLDQIGTEEYASARIVVDDRANISNVRYQVESFGYQTASPVDTIEQVNEFFRFFNLVLVGLGSVGMAIAALGMINTLTVSLLERTREIALMMIIGARPRDVRRLFTIEAILLALSGGLIGISVATVIGFIVNGILNQFAYARGVSESFSVFAISPLLIIGLLGLMTLIGLIVAYVPARRAARILPIDVLREE